MNPNIDQPPVLLPPPTPPEAAERAPIVFEVEGRRFEIPPECIPDYDKLVVEDGQPVDSTFTEKQMRLWSESLYSSWAGPVDEETGQRLPFEVMTNVGLFYGMNDPPLVPDAQLGIDVRLGADLFAKKNRSYFTWELGKPPRVVIELVSDRRGGEDSTKMRQYASIAVTYYVIFDPQNHLKGGALRAFALRDGKYEPIDPKWMPAAGIGLKQWAGVFENHQAEWLRWCDEHGQVIPTGKERAEQAEQRAEQAEQEREAARRRAEEAERRVAELQERLRAQGVDPST